jgi:DNA mismatch repair protein MutS2
MINLLHGLFLHQGITTVVRKDLATKENREEAVKQLTALEREEADWALRAIDLAEERLARLEEALAALERQMDAAVLAGLHEFSVVHGKGDGILQKGVHDFLKKQPAVADYYFSRPELGGFGRTEVILRE